MPRMQQAAVRKEHTVACSRSQHVEMQWIHLCTGFLFSKGVDFSLPEQIVHRGKVCWGKHWCCAVQNAANIGQTNPSLSTNGRSTWSQAGSASSHKIRCRFQNIILFTEHKYKWPIHSCMMSWVWGLFCSRRFPQSHAGHADGENGDWADVLSFDCLLGFCLWNYTEITSYITSSNWMMEVTNTHNKGWLIGT